MKSTIKKHLSAIILCHFVAVMGLFVSLQTSAQTIDEWQVRHLVQRHISQFPVTHLADLYKTCFQDIFGSEHLASDTAAVIKYVRWEVTQPENELNPIYEPCGMQGNFVRVNIRVVKENIITERQLADAFIRSSSMGKQTKIEDWTKQWHEIVKIIGKMDLNLPSFSEDSLYIENMLARGEYAWVHSRAYHDEYLPHYRIIAKDIFYKEIYPLLKRRK